MESSADSARVRENVVLLAVCGPGARLDFAAVDDNILRVIRAPEAGADACRVFAALHVDIAAVDNNRGRRTVDTAADGRVFLRHVLRDHLALVVSGALRPDRQLPGAADVDRDSLFHVKL